MAMDDFSLEAVKALIQYNSNVRNFLRKEFVQTYDEFIEVLYDELDLVVALLEQNPQKYDADDEDKITLSVVSLLKMRNYSATQGTTSGGNVDITVAGNNPLWNWICEAKIFSAIEALNQGFLQLTTRYRNASTEFSNRGILAYIKRSDAAAHMREWGTHLDGLKLSDFKRTDCPKRKGLAFFTTHKDTAGGLELDIRHNSVTLYHLPEDRSGLAAKKYKARHEEAGTKERIVKKPAAKKPAKVSKKK